MTLSTGMLLSMFATKMSTVYVTYGLVAGVGAGVIHYCGNTILGPHFNEKWRPLAMSFASIGTSVGSLALPPLMTWILDEHNWRRTFLCLSCVCLIGIPSGLAFSPTEKQTTQATEENQSVRTMLKKSFRRLAKNCNYLIFFISTFLIALTLYGPATFLPDLMQEFNRTSSQITASVMCQGAGDLIGRVGFGIIAHKMSEHLSLVFGFSTLLFGISSGVTVFVGSSAMFIIFAFLTGIGMGGISGLHTAMTAKFVHSDDLRIGIGIVYFSGGIAFVSGMPLAGIFTDLLHTVRGSFAFLSIISVLAAILIFLIAARERHICGVKREYQVRNQEQVPKTDNIKYLGE